MFKNVNRISLSSGEFAAGAQAKQTRLLLQAGLFLFALICTLLIAGQASAHGYIEAPASRASLCADKINKNCGAIINEPQSVEGPKGYPQAGPADGQIAGAGKWTELDAQSADRWTKVDVYGGPNTFQWKLTMPHKTTNWNYYITKINWDANAPLSREQLEPTPFCTYTDNGAVPAKKVEHVCNVPEDRSGYHLIVGIWTIDDTINAFYQVVDVNLINDGRPNPNPPSQQKPTVPVVTAGQSGFDYVSLSWTASVASAGISHYEIYRDCKSVASTSERSYKDEFLNPETSYAYSVVAVDRGGNRSEASPQLTLTTGKVQKPDTAPPTQPSNLLAKNQTATSAELTWSTSTDDTGVVKYEIYRNGNRIGESASNAFKDTGLTPSTSYTYAVAALDAAGNRSALSSPATVVTLVKPADHEWDASSVYLGGNRVLYKGIYYTAQWWTQGNAPDVSDVWKPDAGTVQNWNAAKAYVGQDIVVHNGKSYRAKWWTKGDLPGQSDVWTAVN